MPRRDREIIGKSRRVGRPRAQPKPICDRGHSISIEGFYEVKKQVKRKSINGEEKTYTYIAKTCRRCRIEDVQNFRKKKMKLPNRRPGITLSIKHINSSGNEDKIIVTAGVDTKTDRVAEVFVANPMVGSDMEAILTDGCILISLCLQAGISLDELIFKLGDRREHYRDTIGAPTSYFGSIVRAAKQIDQEIEALPPQTAEKEKS